MAAGPGSRSGSFFYEISFRFRTRELVPDLTWSGPVRSLFTFCLDAKSNKKIKAPEKWLPAQAAGAGLSFMKFLFVFVHENLCRTLPGPDLSGLCLLFALMQKVTKKSRLQKNG